MSIVDRLVGMVSPRRRALRRGVRLAEQGQMKRAFPLLVRAATAGIAEAEFRVGRCYLEGVGVPASRAQGARWLQRAGDQGYVEAQALLATLYIHGMASDASSLPKRRCNQPVQCQYHGAARFRRRREMGPPRRRRRVGRRPGLARLHPDLGAGEASATSTKRCAGTRNPPPPAARRAISATRCRWRAATPPRKPRPRSPNICGGPPRPACQRRCICSA